MRRALCLLAVLPACAGARAPSPTMPVSFAVFDGWGQLELCVDFDLTVNEDERDRGALLRDFAEQFVRDQRGARRLKAACGSLSGRTVLASCAVDHPTPAVGDDWTAPPRVQRIERMRIVMSYYEPGDLDDGAEKRKCLQTSGEWRDGPRR